jgi:ATP-dependent Clp protease protease subunit
MGAQMLALGAEGRRFSLPHTRIMIHQPSIHQVGGKVTDVEIITKEVQKQKEILTRMLADRCHKNYDEVLAAMDRDNFMSPEEAKKFGLIDEIIEKRA